MYKRLSKIVLVHLLIILYWGFLYKLDMIVKEDPIINMVSIVLIMTLYLLIYTDISNKDINKTYSNIFIILSLGLLALILQEDIRFKILLAIVSLSSTGIYTKKYMIYENARNINIFPISKSSAQIFTIGLLIFSFIIIYLFDLNSLMINLFIHLMFLSFEIFFILFLKEKEDTYEKTYRLYYLSDYMANERDEFARIIHDEIIQDIFASRNYLSLKNPDIDYAKGILAKLEGKCRRIMKFYQYNLFEKTSLETSIFAIFDNIVALYPNKNIKVEKNIERELIENKDKNLTRLISIISKELVNNVYKHSNGSYLNYRIYRQRDLIIIELESDGTEVIDFKNIKESKRGILLLNLLLDSNSGNISYKLNGDILYTRVELEANENENFFIR